jgi:hypothetical protein
MRALVFFQRYSRYRRATEEVGVWFFSTFLESNLPHPHGRLPLGRLVPHFGTPVVIRSFFFTVGKRDFVVLVEGGQKFLPISVMRHRKHQHVSVGWRNTYRDGVWFTHQEDIGAHR